MHKFKNWRRTRKQKTLNFETNNTNSKVVKIYITQRLGGSQWTFHAHKYYKYREASKGIVVLWNCFGDYSSVLNYSKQWASSYNGHHSIRA
jgi:hypothetical protein